MDDSTRAIVVGGRVETRPETEEDGGSLVAFGLDFELIQTDDDLHADNTQVGSDVTSDVLAWDLTPYVGLYPQFGEMFELPVVLGLFVSDLRLDLFAVDEEVEWLSVGGKAAVRPEIALVKGKELSFGLFGEAMAGWGISSVETTFPPLAGEGFDTDVALYGFEAGAFLRAGNVDIGVSYLFRAADYEESDPFLGITIRGIQTQFSGVMVRGVLRL